MLGDLEMMLDEDISGMVSKFEGVGPFCVVGAEVERLLSGSVLVC